jgi:hypothetical protein
MKGLSAATLGSLMLATAAQAQTVSDKNCIFAAAQKLPAIAGMQISASRTKQLTAEMQQTWKLERDRFIGAVTSGSGQRSNVAVSALVVDIDIQAAAQESTLSFLCFFAAGFPAHIISVGLTR